ncbi:hypothetical protein RUND412_009636, partial [Rhizina undulata]
MSFRSPSTNDSRAQGHSVPSFWPNEDPSSRSAIAESRRQPAACVASARGAPAGAAEAASPSLSSLSPSASSTPSNDATPENFHRSSSPLFTPSRHPPKPATLSVARRRRISASLDSSFSVYDPDGADRVSRSPPNSPTETLDKVRMQRMSSHHAGRSTSGSFPGRPFSRDRQVSSSHAEELGESNAEQRQFQEAVLDQHRLDAAHRARFNPSPSPSSSYVRRIRSATGDEIIVSEGASGFDPAQPSSVFPSPVHGEPIYPHVPDRPQSALSIKSDSYLKKHSRNPSSIGSMDFLNFSGRRRRGSDASSVSGNSAVSGLKDEKEARSTVKPSKEKSDKDSDGASTKSKRKQFAALGSTLSSKLSRTFTGKKDKDKDKDKEKLKDGELKAIPYDLLPKNKNASADWTQADLSLAAKDERRRHVRAASSMNNLDYISANENERAKDGIHLRRPASRTEGVATYTSPTPPPMSKSYSTRDSNSVLPRRSPGPGLDGRRSVSVSSLEGSPRMGGGLSSHNFSSALNQQSQSRTERASATTSSNHDRTAPRQPSRMPSGIIRPSSRNDKPLPSIPPRVDEVLSSGDESIHYQKLGNSTPAPLSIPRTRDSHRAAAREPGRSRSRAYSNPGIAPTTPIKEVPSPEPDRSHRMRSLINSPPPPFITRTETEKSNYFNHNPEDDSLEVALGPGNKFDDPIFTPKKPSLSPASPSPSPSVGSGASSFIIIDESAKDAAALFHDDKEDKAKAKKAKERQEREEREKQLETLHRKRKEAEEREELERQERERREREIQDEERRASERRERERKEHEEREERERLERLDQERRQAEAEAEAEAQRKEQQRLEKQQLEKERLEKERQEQEQERLEKERLETERQEKERLEHERLQKHREEKERLEKEREQERKERKERERQEQERIQKERAEAECLETERHEQERKAKEKKEEEERRERERKEARERRELELKQKLEEKKERERQRQREEEALKSKEKLREEEQRKEELRVQELMKEDERKKQQQAAEKRRLAEAQKEQERKEKEQERKAKEQERKEKERKEEASRLAKEREKELQRKIENERRVKEEERKKEEARKKKEEEAALEAEKKRWIEEDRKGHERLREEEREKRQVEDLQTHSNGNDRTTNRRYSEGKLANPAKVFPPPTLPEKGSQRTRDRRNSSPSRIGRQTSRNPPVSRPVSDSFVNGGLKIPAMPPPSNGAPCWLKIPVSPPASPPRQKTPTNESAKDYAERLLGSPGADDYDTIIDLEREAEQQNALNIAEPENSPLFDSSKRKNGNGNGNGNPSIDQELSGLRRRKLPEVLQEDDWDDSLNQLMENDNDFADLLSGKNEDGAEENETVDLLARGHQFHPHHSQKVRSKEEVIVADQARERERIQQAKLMNKLQTLQMEIRDARRGIDVLERRLNGGGISDESELLEDDERDVLLKRLMLEEDRQRRLLSVEDSLRRTKTKSNSWVYFGFKVAGILVLLAAIWFALELAIFLWSLPPSYSSTPIIITDQPEFGTTITRAAIKILSYIFNGLTWIAQDVLFAIFKLSWEFVRDFWWGVTSVVGGLASGARKGPAPGAGRVTEYSPPPPLGSDEREKAEGNDIFDDEEEHGKEEREMV